MSTMTVTTRDGRSIDIIWQGDLQDPISISEQIRAYCHLHGGDHQRSLSISHEGWGYCHTCHRTVLLYERDPVLAERLLHRPTSARQSSLRSQSSAHRQQIMRPPQPKHAPRWQQDEQRLLLSLDEVMREALCTSQKARAYLQGRALSLDIAQQAGVCYVPPEMLNWPQVQPYAGLLSRWSDRILFPLNSPQGRGYIGRSLWHWEPGMDENQHKAVLDQPKTPRRWRKTNPAGWFGYEPKRLSPSLVLVEGGFDRLALLGAELRACDVLALAGTAARPEWLAGQVKGVVLALDADKSGFEAMQRLAAHFRRTDVCVELCPPPQDQWGKDWNERWRHVGPQCVWPIQQALARLCQAS